jgi:predicted ABC-type transport system involved in lysophospholipase L1 biosynthesis ATPase subunit
MVLITHEPDIADAAERKVSIRDGRLTDEREAVAR